MHLALRGLAVAAAAAFLATPAIPAQAAIDRSGVEIDMIYYGDRSMGRSHGNEYIRLKNESRRTVNLDGWTVGDRQFSYEFDRYRLRPGQRVVLHTGPGRDRPGHLFWNKRRGDVWNNFGFEAATLRNAYGHRVDTCAYRAPLRNPFVFC